MKRALLILTITLFFQSIIFPQELQIAAKEVLTREAVQEKTYPIPGSHFLREKEQRLIEYFEQHPEINRLAKTRSTAWDFEVEDTHEWWADYFEDQDSGEEQYLVPSTCRAVGTNCYVFVEDAAWGTDRVDQAAVDAIVDAFDNSTPADAPNNDGIYNVDTRTFGAPPDVDTDPKIIILILDIIDDYSGSGGYVAGYFYSANEYTDPAPGGARSNVAEIFYMDSNPAVLTTENGRLSVLGTTTHEFQHMIHWAHDPNEVTFVNEGLSEISEYICGYELRSSSGYAGNTNVYLFGWDVEGNVLNDYSRAALWTLYLYEQFPDGFLKNLVQNAGNKNAGINSVMLGTGRTYNTTYVDWIIANHLQDNTIDSKWGYDYSPITKPQATTHYITTATGAGTIKKLAAEYISFVDGTPFKITFTGQSTLHFKMIKTGPSGSVVEDIDEGVEYDISDFGTTYTKVTFIIYRDDELFDTNLEETYSYTAIGSGSGPQTVELSYEDGVPEGYLQFATGDSIAVFFTGIAGAKLDSIKVAFRRAGSIQMEINEHDGQNFMRGTNLHGPVQINSPKETASVNPYPVPYDNWVTVNLTSQNIDASNDFVVSFLIGNDPSAPGIMVSSEPDDGVRHSRTYIKDDDTWYPYGVQGTPGNIWNYLVRAYVTIGGITVAIDQTGIVTIPDKFSLEQNYPNPFNPSTTFRFSTPKDGLVKFTVHDLLGRVIYSENRNLFAGNYSFTWNGQNQLDQQVVSGVYFLRMEAEGFSQTRKMLLLR